MGHIFPADVDKNPFSYERGDSAETNVNKNKNAHNTEHSFDNRACVDTQGCLLEEGKSSQVSVEGSSPLHTSVYKAYHIHGNLLSCLP